jgi:hypothetical protein
LVDLIVWVVPLTLQDAIKATNVAIIVTSAMIMKNFNTRWMKKNKARFNSSIPPRPNRALLPRDLSRRQHVVVNIRRVFVKSMQDVSSRALRFNITHKRREMQLVEMQVVVVEDVEEEALEEVVVVDGVVGKSMRVLVN